jgi:TonB family protein
VCRHLITRHPAASCLILASLFAFAPLFSRASDVESQLRDQYRGKILVLRGFYSGKSLHYDSIGEPAKGTMPGDWTVDGVVRVEDVSISGDHLMIRVSRIHWVWLRDSGFAFIHDFEEKAKRDEKEYRSLQIKADLGPGGSTAASAETAFSRIFLTSHDNFADLVPNYWKSCVRVAAGDINDSDFRSCRFSAEFLSVPGVVLRPGLAENSEPATPYSGILRAGTGGTSMPKVTSMSDPEFSEAARNTKFHGTVTLKLVVNEKGVPTNIRIVSPIGCGLDEKAVQAVATWRFKPSEKDGKPIAVEIATEVDFHMY